jgi:hypothetical protein
MEGKLRALGEGAGQDEQEGGQIVFAALDCLAGPKELVHVVAAGDVPQHHKAQQQAHPAGGGDDQRHPRAIARTLVVMPVADQQEREDARQLPEEDQLDEIAGEHQAQHRSHEGQEEGEKPRHRIFGRHVIARIEDDQRADAQDQRRKEP